MDINPEVLEHFGPWIKDLAEWAVTHERDMVLTEGANMVILVGSELPTEEERMTVQLLIPSDYMLEFIEGPHTHTVKSIIEIAMASLAMPDPIQTKDHFVKLNLHGMPELANLDILWEAIGRILERDKYVRSYELSLNGKPVFGKTEEATEKTKPVDTVAKVRETLQGSVTVEDFLRSSLFNNGGKE